MESRGSSTPFAARVTSSARRGFDRLPIRWRLAASSAALTFVILCGFAGIVGILTSRQVRGQFDDQVRDAANELARSAHPEYDPTTDEMRTKIQLGDFARSENAQV